MTISTRLANSINSEIARQQKHLAKLDEHEKKIQLRRERILKDIERLKLMVDHV